MGNCTEVSNVRRQFSVGALMFLHVLCTEALTAFILCCLFKDVCVVNNLGRYSVSVLSEGHISL